MAALPSRLNSAFARLFGVRAVHEDALKNVYGPVTAATADLTIIVERLVRVSQDQQALAQQIAWRMNQFAPMANQANAVERLQQLGRLLQPQRAVGVEKVRLGALHDGGYVCLDDFDDVVAALSFGLAGEVSWDTALADKGLIVHQYDHTVPGPPVSHANFRFGQRKIGAFPDSTTDTVETVLEQNHLTRRNSVIMKMDIEHDEWDALAAMSSSSLDVLTQILCEFHNFSQVTDDRWFSRAIAVLSKLNEKFAVVHVHANNYGPLLAVGTVLFPQVLEVSYANRSKYTFEESDELFPGKLDGTNNPFAPDHQLGRFIY